MPASAVQTKTWFSPNGWFTDRELSIVVNRVLRDDPSKGDMHNQRALAGIAQPLWTLPCIIALRFWPGIGITHPWATYAITFVLLSYPYCHAINVGWASKNSNNVAARSVSTALYNMFVQLGGISASYIYVAKDAPLYHVGNTRLLAINVAIVFVFLFAK